MCCSALPSWLSGASAKCCTTWADLVAHQRNLARRRVVGRGGPQTQKSPLADQPSVGIEVLDADVVEIAGAVHRGLQVRLGDQHQVARAALAADVARERVGDAAADACGRRAGSRARFPPPDSSASLPLRVRSRYSLKPRKVKCRSSIQASSACASLTSRGIEARAAGRSIRRRCGAPLRAFWPNRHRRRARRACCARCRRTTTASNAGSTMRSISTCWNDSSRRCRPVSALLSSMLRSDPGCVACDRENRVRQKMHGQGRAA